MDAISKDSGRLAWLAAVLSEQRHRLAALLQRLGSLGQPGAIKPSLFRKFLEMLDQISVAKEKESMTIARIEAIEAKHRFQRKCKGLKYADFEAEPQKHQNPEINREPECERPNTAWIWLLAIFAIVGQQGINQKKQSLTAD